MFCSNCGTTLTPSPGFGATRCFSCGQFTAAAAPTAQQAQQQAAAARFLEDRNNNGIPDVLEGPAAAALLAGRAPFSAPLLTLEQVPPAPRQASPRARELIFGYQGSQGVRMLIGVIFLVIGVVMSTIFCWGIPADLAIALFGTRVTGTVVGTEIQSSVSVNHRHPQLVHYTFRLDGASYTGSSSTLNYTPGSPKAGSPIQVEALSMMPSFSRAAGTTSSIFGYGTVFILIFPFLGGAFALAAWRENQREIRAFLQGTPIAATVVYQGPDLSTKSNGRHPFKIDWQFQVGAGVYKGSLSHMSRGAIADLASSGQIIVLYDPRNPRINTAYVS